MSEKAPFGEDETVSKLNSEPKRKPKLKHKVRRVEAWLPVKERKLALLLNELESFDFKDQEQAWQEIQELIAKRRRRVNRV